MVSGFTTMPDLGHGNGHARLGHGVHRGGNDGNVQRDRAGDARADVGFRRKHIRKTGLKKNVVESERLAGRAVMLDRHCQPYPSGRRRSRVKRRDAPETSWRRWLARLDDES
jgi:hypothetical protein